MTPARRIGVLACHLAPSETPPASAAGSTTSLRCDPCSSKLSEGCPLRHQGATFFARRPYHSPSNDGSSSSLPTSRLASSFERLIVECPEGEGAGEESSEPTSSTTTHTLSLNPTAQADAPAPAPASSSITTPTYASIDGKPSTYARVHGEVSTAPVVWSMVQLSGEPFADIIYEKSVGEGIAKITINRPERRNAFRPETIIEMQHAFSDARDDPNIGVIILTGQGTQAFCSGGDQAVRQIGGYVGRDKVPRLNVLDLQIQIRRLPKPVIAMVAGYAVGGGHILHMICDLTIAADNAVFGQTGPKVGSFDAGYGCSMMARLVGQKKAREMWFLARFYSAQEALRMNLVNTVVPLDQLERETVKWSREILRNSPTAIRLLKSSLNAIEDGHAGLQDLAGHATMLFYHNDEALEGRNAYLEGRAPDFSKFKRLP
ncbi:hypothetical protein CBR_g40708 [Chara braunii]|uniref:1,4-dihydroxy-2-naphthoyl-CoA synthase n=1 Tax=Chara braunii TaxID=69332 RepID=A0A388LUF2_CHABU|nr:hypothetical protein CBR_g40708 [Chara braunii]|eukprot:GBG85895.1 hypothetical protein CBR_g40708 [Chara braunii]